MPESKPLRSQVVYAMHFPSFFMQRNQLCSTWILMHSTINLIMSFIYLQMYRHENQLLMVCEGSLYAYPFSLRPATLRTNLGKFGKEVKSSSHSVSTYACCCCHPFESFTLILSHAGHFQNPSLEKLEQCLSLLTSSGNAKVCCFCQYPM